MKHTGLHSASTIILKMAARIDIEEMERQLVAATAVNALPRNIERNLQQLRQKGTNIKTQIEGDIRAAVQSGQVEETKIATNIQTQLSKCLGLISRNRTLLNSCISQCEIHKEYNATFKNLAKTEQRTLSNFQLAKLVLHAGKGFTSAEPSVTEADARKLFDALGELATEVAILEGLLGNLDEARSSAINISLAGLRQLVALIKEIAVHFVHSTIPLIDASLITENELKASLRAIAQEYIEDAATLESYIQMLNRPIINP